MVSKRKIATAAATSFGVALSSVYFAPELQADIMDITYNGGNATASVPGAGSAQADIDQVNGAVAADIFQFNDTIGRTMSRVQTTTSTYVTTGTYTTTGGSTFPYGTFVTNTLFGGIQSFAAVGLSQTLNAATFAGATTLGPSVFNATSSSATGTAFVGFRTFDGNVGWFTVNFTGLTGSQQSLSYGAGEYGSAGESVHVGGTIPEPSTAGVLAGIALGASAIRRRRKKCKPTQA